MSRSFIILCVLILLLFVPEMATPSDDWTYELTDTAKVIYENKEVQTPCSDIPSILNSKRPYKQYEVYNAIRDAGLFRDQTCEQHIKYLEELDLKEDKDFIDIAISFYRLRMGDESQLQFLLDVYDKEARKYGGDHATVELFGFLPGWDKVGRRLVGHASYSDGGGAELLCSAIMWRRYLYGEEEFKENWFKIGREEGVKETLLKYLLDRCK